MEMDITQTNIGMEKSHIKNRIKEKNFQRSYYAATMKLVQIKDETSVEGKIRF